MSKRSEDGQVARGQTTEFCILFACVLKKRFYTQSYTQREEGSEAESLLRMGRHL